MFEEQNKRLVEIKEKMRKLDKLKDSLRIAQSKLEEEKAKIKEYELLVKKEEKDLDKVEGKGIVSLFYSVLGSRDEQIDKQRQEYLAVKLKYDQYQSGAAAIEEDIRSMKQSISEIGNVENEYKELISIKERMIASANDINSRKLIEMTEEINDIELDKKEINEAISAGNDARKSLQNMIEALKSAEGWGIWDMAGGDLIATSIKHSKMDDAMEYAGMAQQSLTRFQRELSDVENEMQNLNIELTSFENFADYFFDNIITDWVVQSKIEESLSGALNMEAKVRTVIHDLERRLEAANQRQKQLKNQKTELLEQTE